jgi:hypothetical protein
LEYYTSIKEGLDINIEAKPSYLKYVKSEQEYLNSPKYIKDREYWLEKFKDKPSLVSIKLKNNEHYNSRAKRMTFTLGGEQSDAKGAFAKKTQLHRQCCLKQG